MALSTPLTKGISLLEPGQSDPAVQELRARYLINETGYLSSPSQLVDNLGPQTGHVMVKNAEGRCIALLRLIHGGPAGFELEPYLNPRDYMPVSDRSIEVSELIVDSEARASTTTLQLGLGFAKYLKIHQPDTLFSLSTRETASHYHRLGMTVRWDVSVRAIWGVEAWLCYAHPATVVLDHLLNNAPAVYRRTVAAYLDSEPVP
ncbi:MAG: hypothetical protein PHP86_07740 [Nevskiales bacterium]|nr:hypothetical protein [Nevskiales bacterium]